MMAKTFHSWTTISQWAASVYLSLKLLKQPGCAFSQNPDGHSGFSISPLQSADHSINTHTKPIKSTGAGSIMLSKTCICLPCQTRDVYWYQLQLNWFLALRESNGSHTILLHVWVYWECHPGARNTRNQKTTGHRRRTIIPGVNRAKNIGTSLLKCQLKAMVRLKFMVIAMAW